MDLSKTLGNSLVALPYTLVPRPAGQGRLHASRARSSPTNFGMSSPDCFDRPQLRPVWLGELQLGRPEQPCDQGAAPGSPGWLRENPRMLDNMQLSPANSSATNVGQGGRASHGSGKAQRHDGGQQVRRQGKDTAVLVLHGPNLNLLGTREPAVYGHDTLRAINARLEAQARAAGMRLLTFQSNHEGALVDRVQAARNESVRYVLINPAGVHPYQRGAARRAGRSGHSRYRDPPVQRSCPRAVPPPLVFLGQGSRHDRRTRRAGLRTGAAICAAPARRRS